MVDGVEYNTVLEINNKADYMGFIIISPAMGESLIQPVTTYENLFKVNINELRYPTVNNPTVHRGNFKSVVMFITGAYFIHESLVELGVITEDKVREAAQHFILMDTIRGSGL